MFRWVIALLLQQTEQLQAFHVCLLMLAQLLIKVQPMEFTHGFKMPLLMRGFSDLSDHSLTWVVGKVD